MSLVEVFTDGACLGNPGPGGWGALLRAGRRERELSGGEPDTTNNRMELMAAIAALEALTRPCEVVLCTDSQYVRQGITEWLANWERRGWRTAAGGEVKNRDLWERLHAASQRHRQQQLIRQVLAYRRPVGHVRARLLERLLDDVTVPG